MADKAATLNDVRKFFEYESAADFRKEWMQLSESDRTEIKAGLTDGTLTY